MWFYKSNIFYYTKFKENCLIENFFVLYNANFYVFTRVSSIIIPFCGNICHGEAQSIFCPFFSYWNLNYFFLLYAFFEAYYGRISWCSRFFCISLMHIWIFHVFVIIGLFVGIFFHSVFDDKRFTYIFIFHLLHLIYPVIENISSYL